MLKKAPQAFALLRVTQEVRRSAGGERPVAIAGASELVPLLAKELRTGGDAGAVVEGARTGAAALVWIGAADDDALRAASRAGTPIVGVTDGQSLPYVLDTNLVSLVPGKSLPVDEIAAALARALGREGVGLAARLPMLRDQVIDELIESTAKRNALIGAAVFVPGVDMPILTLNEAKLVLQIALAHGRELDSKLWPEILAVVGAGFGLRRVAAELLDLVPVAGWAVKGGVAFAGTRAIGEAARRRFA
ncbi:MAG TPA: hypothetical protein VGM80_15080 [Gaiellaceae bacterium]